jgi:hypothetical protein
VYSRLSVGETLPPLHCVCTQHIFYTLVHSTRIDRKTKFLQGIKCKELHARFHYILEKSAKKINKEDYDKSILVTVETLNNDEEEIFLI